MMGYRAYMFERPQKVVYSGIAYEVDSYDNVIFFGGTLHNKEMTISKNERFVIYMPKNERYNRTENTHNGKVVFEYEVL